MANIDWTQAILGGMGEGLNNYARMYAAKKLREAEMLEEERTYQRGKADEQTRYDRGLATQKLELDRQKAEREALLDQAKSAIAGAPPLPQQSASRIGGMDGWNQPGQPLYGAGNQTGEQVLEQRNQAIRGGITDPNALPYVNQLGGFDNPPSIKTNDEFMSEVADRMKMQETQAGIGQRNAAEYRTRNPVPKTPRVTKPPSLKGLGTAEDIKFTRNSIFNEEETGYGDALRAKIMRGKDIRKADDKYIGDNETLQKYIRKYALLGDALKQLEGMQPVPVPAGGETLNELPEGAEFQFEKDGVKYYSDPDDPESLLEVRE